MSGAGDIKRRIELYVVGILRGKLPAFTIVPNKGGDDAADAEEVEPPFVLVKATECEQVLAEPPTHQAVVKVAYFAHLHETTSPEHSAKVGDLGVAVRALPNGYYVSTDLTINGTDVQRGDEVRDDEQKIHGDVFVIDLGATEGAVT